MMTMTMTMMIMIKISGCGFVSQSLEWFFLFFYIAVNENGGRGDPRRILTVYNFQMSSGCGYLNPKIDFRLSSSGWEEASL